MRALKSLRSKFVADHAPGDRDPEAFGPFFSELVHVIRNAIDHGLETGMHEDGAQRPRRPLASDPNRAPLGRE